MNSTERAVGQATTRSIAVLGALVFSLCSLAALATGCSPTDAGTSGSGGARTATGGANVGTGGAASTGGANGSGGAATATGGNMATGGAATASGGATGTGGTTLGTGGAPPSTGGSSATGGGSGATGGAGTAGSSGRGGGSAGAGGGSAGGAGGVTASSGGAGGGTACGGTNRAASFNGTNGVVVANLGTDAPLGDTARTVEMWVYTKATTWRGEVNTLFEYGNRNAARGVFGTDFANYDDVRGNIQFYVGDGTYDYFFNGGLGAAAYVGWFHLATTYDPTTKTIRSFVNGVQKGTRTLTAAMTLQTQMEPLSIGRSRWYPNALTSANPAYFDGYMDEVRVWNVARTPAQIMANMNRRLAGGDATLVGYWHFDEESGTSAADASGKNHNGTIEGGVTFIANPGVTLTCP